MSMEIHLQIVISVYLLLSGVESNEYDPLPAGVRNVLASNHLAESTPEIFSEYHALLPNFRGDYGIKSKLVAAATEEPIYKGADTYILPLYIPRGAVPFRVQDRLPRSGAANGQPNMRIVRGPTPSVSAIERADYNRPVLRRIVGTGRRHFSSPRHNPTPPPSFIRPWIRRRGTIASEDISGGIEDAKRLKQLVQVRKRLQPHPSESIGSLSVAKPDVVTDTDKDSESIGGASVFKKVTITPLRRPKVRHTTLSHAVSSEISVTTVNPGKITSKSSEIQEPSEKETKESITQLLVIPTTVQSIEPRQTDEENGSNAEEQDEKSTKNTLKTRIHLLMPKTPEERNAELLKNATTTAATTTEATSLTTSTDSLTPASLLRHRLPLVSSSSTSTLDPISDQTSSTKTVEASSTVKTTTPINLFPLTSLKTTPSSKAERRSSSGVNSKPPAWLLRRRPSSRKRNRPKQKKENSESIIDRVLSSAANHTESTTQNPISVIHSKTYDKRNGTRYINKNNATKLNVQSVRKHNASDEPILHTKTIQNGPILPFKRPRIPIRVRHPIVSNPVTPVKDGTQEKRTYSRDEDKSKEENPEVSAKSFKTNSITTSTSRQPWLYSTIPSIKPKNREPLGTILSPFSLPPLKSKLPLGNPLGHDTSSITTPRLKSAQDIVLEKLTKLMSDATNKSKSIEDIARELEILNQELSILGIHIIDAEFGGHKLDLRDFSMSSSIHKVKRPIHFSTKALPTSTSSPVTRNDRVPVVDVQQPTVTPVLNSEKVKGSSVWKNEEQKKISYNSNTTIVSTSPLLKSNIDEENKDISISATSTTSSSEFTRTRSTTVPIEIANTDNKPSEEQSHVRKSNPTVSSVAKQNHTENDANILSNSETKYDEVDNDIDRTTSTTTTTTTEPVTSKYFNKTATDKSIPSVQNGVKDIRENFIRIHQPDNQIPGHASETRENFEKTEAGSYIYLIGILGIVPFGVLLFLIYRQRKKRKEKPLPEREEGADGFTPPITHVRSSVAKGTLDTVPPFTFGDSESPWELPRSKLRLTSIIGEGNFGVVWKAEARNLCEWEEDGGPTVIVAVKGVKEDAGPKEKQDLLRELSIMQLLGQHNNIVTLLGCCTTQEPYFLVMEYVMFGRLLTFLRDHRSRNNYYNFSSDIDHLTSKDLTKFASQVAAGCEYLQSRGVIHRDLAARNILVDHNKVCKIADFGLARSVKDLDSDIYEQKSRGPLPIRWMAPESLYMNIFTHKSDVWSFGILCWEIVTLGSTPYPGVSAREVMRRVREGYRLERPEHCLSEFYQILSECWHQDLNKRPSFKAIKEALRELLETPTGWIDLDNFQESNYYSMHENTDEKL